MTDASSVTPATAEPNSEETTATAEPKLTEAKWWADVADEPEEVPVTSDEECPPSLTIGYSKRRNQTLSDPDYFSIKTETSGNTTYTSAKRFEDLNLSAELLKGLYVEMKFERPNKIHEISLPMILTPPHKNLIAQAHDGSGKTTCLVLGTLSRVDPKLPAPQALCICPTRELAIQNMEVLLNMGKYTGITSVLAIPADGQNYLPVSKLPPIDEQVVIGTPGTIRKWMTAKKLSMSFMKILVFDEADNMLAESGFRDDSVKIMRVIVKSCSDCQVLLFSATFNDAVIAFANKINEELFVRGCNYMFVEKEELSLEPVKQYKVYCDRLEKFCFVQEMLEFAGEVGQIIIFVQTRDDASALAQLLVASGYEVTTIQGALTEKDRDKIVKESKEGLVKVLISTEGLDRGFDQSQVNLVVNFDLPARLGYPSEPDFEVYRHRVSRAGHFGKGAVFNLLCNKNDEMLLKKIEKYFHKNDEMLL